MIDGAILDMDGTILESMGVWATVGEDYLRRRGIIPCHGDADSLMYQGMRGIASHFRTAYGIADEDMKIIEDLNEMVKEDYANVVTPKDGAIGFLRMLRERGIRLCLATATDRCIVEPTLARLQMLELFDGIVTCTEVGVGKHKPLVFDTARQLLGTSLDTTWVFEDAAYAAVTAKTAGYHVCAVYDSFERRAEELRAHADVYLLGYHEASKLPFWR